MNERKEELDELRGAVWAFLAAKSPVSAVRAAVDTGYDPAVWDQMARQLRLPGLALPGEYGGDGFGLTELEVVLEVMAAALRPSSPRWFSPPRRCSPRPTRRPAPGTCPGGIGFSWEHPAHLYFRRAKSCELLFGGPAVYHERLLDRLGI